ncbi:flavin reductase family protein [Mycobacterium deserti]|uniref:Flavin reductase family protein n=1 Tax=Mycobacterium deserti TaxID=2978347 RepID=A0ABT2MEM5_9MYCO|nr:flavin reductase family protein [Mycobacterium deserti]MCT7660697.1 flavin reductase family protein [Mycobacterium deserti]
MAGITPVGKPPQQHSVQAGFREVMAGVCTPVSIVTAMADQQPHGTTVSAFASLSMDPPMVLVSLDRGSELLEMIRATKLFGLNVLSSAQSAEALTFARKGGVAKFAGVPWEVDGGVPRLTDVAGFLVGEVTEFVEGGDHVIVLGLVLTADSVPISPLTYHGRVFGTHAALAEADR